MNKDLHNCLIYRVFFTPMESHFFYTASPTYNIAFCITGSVFYYFLQEIISGNLNLILIVFQTYFYMRGNQGVDPEWNVFKEEIESQFLI